MDAKEFLKAERQMCGKKACNECLLDDLCYRGRYVSDKGIEETIAAVEKWWKDNKPITNREKLIKNLEFFVGDRIRDNMLAADEIIIITDEKKKPSGIFNGPTTYSKLELTREWLDAEVEQ